MADDDYVFLHDAWRRIKQAKEAVDSIIKELREGKQ